LSSFNFSSHKIQTPLAEILRPKSFSELLGQEHLLSNNSSFINLLNSGHLISVILWGNAGTGKTTLAHLIANKYNAFFSELSAVNSGLKELRDIIKMAKSRLESENKQTILFIDEIHRYTKTQQDALLPYLENGTIFLIGATTENPSFQITPALLSRMQILSLKILASNDLLKLIRKGYSYLMTHHGKITLDDKIGEYICKHAAGDARTALNLVESSYFLLKNNPKKHLSLEMIESLTQRNYTKHSIQEHYNLASALQKSIRGSNPDAAIYWLARMISAGEDPRFIARRLIVIASEDIGLADPNAFSYAISTYQSVEILGLPECRIPLSQLVIYLAKASKSNIAYKAIDNAIYDIEQSAMIYSVPDHLKDSHYKDASTYGFGNDYIYSHDHPEIEQDFLPKELVNKKYIKSS
jgi:putative ATPase